MPDRRRTLFDLEYQERVELLTKVQTATAGVIRDAGLAPGCFVTVAFANEVQAGTPMIVVTGDQNYQLASRALQAAAATLLTEQQPDEPEPKNPAATHPAAVARARAGDLRLPADD
jgi:hypothetical protein